MKKAAIAIVSLFVISSSAFAGSYDGIWSSPAFNGIYFMIRNDTSSIIFLQIDDDFSGCDLLMGTLNENIAEIRMLELPKEDHLLEVRIVFTSDTTATGNIISCSGDCDGYPMRTDWELKKIY